MGLFDDLKRFLKRETEDAKEMLSGGVDAGNAALDRAERRLSADPNERLKATLEDIDAGEDSFEEIREKAAGTTATAEAAAELDGEEPVFSDDRTPEPSAPQPEPPALKGVGGAMARLWVRVDPAASAEGGAHVLRIDPTVEKVVGTEWFTRGLLEGLAAHPQIEGAAWDDEGHLVVRSDELEDAAVRLVAAGLLAPHIGEDWQDKLT